MKQSDCGLPYDTSPPFAGGAQKNHGKPWLGQSDCGPKFETGTSRTRHRSTVQYTAGFSSSYLIHRAL
jgi:hypothetical protein